uniref:tectonic-2-like isoform X1 n=2 Tax=Myxine glutinosa TaxID=7769 RepID=UPI00358E523D
MSRVFKFEVRFLLYQICLHYLPTSALEFHPALIHTNGRVVASSFLRASDGPLEAHTVFCTLCGLTATVEAFPSPLCENNISAEKWIVTKETDEELVRLDIYLKNNFQGPLLEALGVTCTSGDESATLMVQAVVPATITANVTESGQSIMPKFYVSLGPCPCDLTTGACDERCCCDSECKPEELSLFSTCLPGIFGGDTNPPFDQLCSSYDSLISPDWFLLLCVQSPMTNSPYLGMFFLDAGEISQSDIDATTSRFDPDFSFAELDRQVLQLHTVDRYTEGISIVASNTGRSQFLSLPQQTLTGQCLDRAPLAFLKDSSSACATILSRAACLTSQRLSMLSYAYNVRNLGQVTVSYCYVDDTSRLVSEPGPHGDGVSLFPETSGTQRQSTAESCGSRSSVTAPVYDERSHTCSDLVVAVTYGFTWKEGNIKGLQAAIVLARNLSTSDTGILTQHFTVTFTNNKGSKPIQRWSGNPGYIHGKSVITGNLIGESINQMEELKIWRPVMEGLCEAAGTVPVGFGEDSFSGCLLHLGLEELQDCSVLRAQVRKKQLELVKSTWVAKRGNSDPNALQEWTPVLWNLTLNTTGAAHGKCVGVPAHVHTRVIIAAIGEVQGQKQYEILAVHTRFYPVTWRVRCGGAGAVACVGNGSVWSFAVSSAVEFISVPAIPDPPKTRFALKYTEYDCDRNDVCWPGLLHPFIVTYIGQSDSSSLAQALTLTFVVLAGFTCYLSAWTQTACGMVS